jgi:ankyrin repeat protein
VKKQALVLYRTAVDGYTDIFQLVIDCDTVSTDGLTLTLRAAYYWGQLSVVQLIVSTLGHRCNTQLLNDCLHWTALRSHTEVVNWLLPLTHPTDTDYIRWDLVQASARGVLTRVTQLVDTIGRDVTDVMSHALWTACCWGRVDIVNWLMTHTSADVNYSKLIYINIGNMTSLAIACYEGRMTVVKRLLNDATLMFDINMVTGNKRNTALHDVIWYSRQTLLQTACYRGDTAAVVDVVYKFDVNMQDRDGRTAMHLACGNGSLETVQVLLSAGADTNITNDRGRTPVAVCGNYGSPELAHYIQHKLSGYDNNDRNITESGQGNQNNTHTLEDSVVS